MPTALLATVPAAVSDGLQGRWPAKFVTAALLCASLVAESASFSQTLDVEDLQGPAESVATAEDPAGSLLNPAALIFLRGHEFHLGYQSAGAGTADPLHALRLGYGVGGRRIAAGLQASFAGGRTQDAERRLGGQLALGGQSFALGLGVSGLHSARPGRAGLWAFDFGLMGRPLKHLSYGFSVRNLASRVLVPRYALGLGTTLGQRRSTLGVSWSFRGDDTLTSANGRLGWRADLRIVDGLSLLASGSHRLSRGPGQHRIQLGVAVNLAHFGVRLTGGPSPDKGSAGALDLRLSTARHPSLSTGVGLAYLELDDYLDADGGFLFRRRRDRFVDLLTLLDRATRDPAVSGVLMHLRGGHSLSFSEVEELRAALMRLKQRHKRVIMYLEAADDALYYLACAADRIFAAPAAVLLVNGLNVSSTYLGSFLRDLGVNAEFAKVGRFKNAPDTLIRDSISDAEREVRHALLSNLSGRYRSAIAKGRGLSQAKVKALLATGLQGAAAALASGFIDGLAYPDELPVVAADPGTKGGRVRLLRHYDERRQARKVWGPAPQIAVIGIEGLIVPGETPHSLFGDPSSVTGARSVMRQLEQAARDPDIRAVVLRINSPGGDAHGSDLIWRAVRQARKSKPVIASMGRVAASGGYYAAAGASRIVAEASTITGSIGIFAGHVEFSGLLRKLGIGQASESTAPLANPLGWTHPWTEAERAAMENFVQAGYQLFLDRVASGRPGLDKKQVDAVGQGRVWTGQQALEKGLVDRLGGFETAVEEAKVAAGIPAPEGIELTRLGEGGEAHAPFGGAQGSLSLIPEPLRAKLLSLGPLFSMLGQGRALAFWPGAINVH